MEELKVGWHWIKLEDGTLLPARWDGDIWHHEKGKSSKHPDHKNIVSALDEPAGGCQTGCRCRQNPDGSWTIEC